MARSAIFLVAFSYLVAALAAPAPAPGLAYQRPLNADCVSTSVNNAPIATGNINFFPQQFRIAATSDSSSAANQVTVTVAKDFSVQYFDNYKVVKNLLVNETYVLYQCGTNAPSTNSLPVGAKMFSMPLTSVAVLETVPIAFLTQLGVMSRAQSVSNFAVGSCGQAVLGCGKTAPSSLTLNSTSLAALQPLTDGVLTSKNNSAATTFAFSAASDPGSLNRAEWIKFLGLFFNLDSTATQIFNNINSSYAQTKASVKPAAKQPVLAFVSLYSYPPDTAFEVSLAAYKTQYTKDAGAVPPVLADILAINGTILSPNDVTNSTAWFTWNSTYGGFASQQEATAAFQKFLQGVDIVVDETFALNPTTYNLTTFLANMNLTSGANYTFLRNNTVYREDGLASPAPSYGLDWFEGALARPDLVLQDFVHAVDPTSSPTYKPTWIRNIAKNETVTITSAQNCNQISSCSAPSTPICPYVTTCGNGSVVSQKNATSTCEYVACSS